MPDTTIRLLAPGNAIQDGDLFISRQGADTVDKAVSGSQLKAYLSASTSALTFTPVLGPTYSAGKLVYDADNESLTFYNNDSNVSMQIGQEIWIRVTNVTGSTIPNGSVVYISGASGGLPTIAPALSSAAATTVGAGLTTEAIANNAIGYVTCIGVVRGLDTSAFTAGQTVYISSTVAGGLTATAPTAPNYRYRVGIVAVSSATVGSIHVTPSTAALGNGTANQVFGMNAAGTAQEVKSIVGTANQVTITNTANTITASLPSSINVNTTGSAATLTTGRTIAITGDLSYTSPAFNGSANVTAAGTLATVNTNVGTFGSATQVGTFTVNGKGLLTAASNTSIQIAESQVTNLVSDLAAKQGTITLTTTGTSGAATFVSNTLNIPNYASGGGSGTVTSVSVVTANGVSGSVATATTTPAITLTLGAITPSSVVASGSVTGSNLSGTNTGDQTITLTGQATGSGTGSFAVTLDNSAVIGKVLTGFASGAGTVSAADSILTAINKLDGNIALKQNLVTLTTTGSGAATFNQGTGALNIPTPAAGGTVTSVSIVSANGFAGSVATATTTPAITLTTSITGVLKGNGTAISAATAGTDYEVPLTFSTGLTRSTNTVTVNTSQNISTLSNLTTNGSVQTTGGTGALSVIANTGTGNNVLATSPTLVTPNLGTPSTLVATNATGTAAGLTAGTVTTNANLTGAVTSVGNATSLGSFTSAQLAAALTDETGTGSNVFSNSPVFQTPNLGTPSSATLTNATGLPLATGVTGTLNANNNPISNYALSIQDFRLTLATGAPVTTTDVTGATTIYAAPIVGNRIALYDGTNWNVRTSAQFSLALGTLTASLPYDVFCYDNAGVPTLEFTAWTNTTTRATALVRQDGVLSKTGALTRRYMGTFYTTGTTTTEDSVANRYLWNYYNRKLRSMVRKETTASWSYATATYRQANGAAANQLNFIIGVSEDIVSAQVGINAYSSGTGQRTVNVGIGLNSTTTTSSTAAVKGNCTNAAGGSYPWAAFDNYTPEGLNRLVWLESGAGIDSQVWYSNTTISGGITEPCGMTGRVFA